MNPDRNSNPATQFVPNLLVILNGFVLAPFGIFLSSIALSGSFDALPTLAFGLMYFAAGIVTSIVLFAVKALNRSKSLLWTLTFLHLLIFSKGLYELSKKPDVISWSEHFTLSSPLIVVPAGSIAFLVSVAVRSQSRC